MMRFFTILLVLTSVSCVSSEVQDTNPITSSTANERRVEFAQSDFDTCQLSTPTETWEYWDVVLSKEDKEKIRLTPYYDLILYHFDWGRGIRNGFCLWTGGRLQTWFNKRGVNHPDSMSSILIRLYWAHLNGCDPKIEAFVRSAYPASPELLRCTNKDFS